MAVRLQNSFHAGRPLLEEQKDAEETKMLTLSNPYQSIPFAIAMAIPAIANEVYIMDAETQIFVCFGLFIGTAYSLGGDAIGAALDEKGKAIMAEHHAIEDAQIASVAVVKDAHIKQATVAADIKDIYDAEKELLTMAIDSAQGALAQATREDVNKKLNFIVNQENNLANSIQSTIVNSATTSVTEGFVASGEKGRAAALTQAMDALAGKASGQDAIGDMYLAHIAATSKTLADMKAAPVALDAAMQKAVSDEIDSIKRRDGLEDLDVAIPTSISFADI